MREANNHEIHWEVDSQRCTGCQRCVRACSERAIRYDKFTGVVVIDRDKCNRCGICVKFCPIEGALFIRPAR